MNNNNSSNTSGSPNLSKANRYYGLSYPKQIQGQSSPTSEQGSRHKIQVLKPIINYKHNANKVIGVDMSQEEYFFYKPILHGKRVVSKQPDQTNNQGSTSQNTKKENSTSNSREVQMTQIHSLSHKEWFKMKINNFTSQKKTLEVSAEREFVGRPSIAKNDGHSSLIKEKLDSSSLSKNQMIGFENIKQTNNNPLKDISNRVINQNNKTNNSTTQENQSKPQNRYSLPFEIAPKSIKINNFLDQPFKQISPQVMSVKAFNDRQFENAFLNEANLTARIEKSNYKIEDQGRPSTQGAGKNYFEKKRLSDNTFKNDDMFKIEEEAIRDIFEKKEKMRKGHNVSVTTNTSTNTNNTNKKLQVSQQYGTTSSHHPRKSISSKISSLNNTLNQNSLISSNINPSLLQNLFSSQEKVLTSIIDSIRSKTKAEFSLRETAKSIREMNRIIKGSSTDNTLIFLVRQHSRTHFIAYAFIRVLEEEIYGMSRLNESLQAIVLNSLDYVKKNIKCFSEIMDQNNKSFKNSKKENVNSDPFGVIGPSTSRNGSNKENYGGNSVTQKQNIGSKSEKKMFIKQNIQIALAFLKKICRMTKQNQEKFKDFINILHQIEGSTQTTKIKEQIRRALQTIRNEQKLQNSTGVNESKQSNQRQSFINQTMRKHKRRESMTIEIEDEIPQEPFAYVKEMDNEESSEDNSQKSNSPAKDNNKITIENLDESSEHKKKRGKENQHPNIIDQPGRLSLQPQPLGGLKINNLFVSNDQKDITSDEKTQQTSGTQQQTLLSIVTKKQQNRLSNTHEPITVRGARPSHRLQFDDQDNLQFAVAPAHINARSNSLPSKEPYLPTDIYGDRKYTLVLDLDETLVHFDPKIRTYRPRPGALKFLSEMSKYYELVVFTAGLKDYADWILNDFDRQRYISYRLYRDHTKYRNGVYMKDLSKLGRDLTKTIIIDNIEENFQAQPDNGIPIKGWYHDPNDKELDRYAPFLKSLVAKKVQDVRPEIKLFRTQLSSVNSFIDHQKQQREKDSKAQIQPSKSQQQSTNYQAWGSDTESESEHKRRSSDEEEEESSEEESPPQKKVIKKKQDSDDSEEEDEEESEEESPSPKKPVQKKKVESDEDEEEEEDEQESPISNKKKNVKPQQQQNKSRSQSLERKHKQETEKFEKIIKELEEKVEKQEIKLEKKEDELKEKEKDIKKLSKKMLDQDEQIQQIRSILDDKNLQIQENEDKITSLEDQLVGKNNVIARQQEEIIDLGKSQTVIENLLKKVHQKEEEIGILKAKIHLDLISMNIKVVAEYPDLVEENNQLYENVELKQREIYDLIEIQKQLKQQIQHQQDEISIKDSKTKELNKEKEYLNKQIKELQLKQHQLQATQYENQQTIQQLNLKMEEKNYELEQRLENISKLIQKNEQLSQQLRVQKSRFEKFKNEQVANYQKTLQDKDSEIEVLKEMVKGNQLQLRAKEKEVIRFKQRVQQLEGMQLAQRQQQNLIMSNQSSSILPPTQSNYNMNSQKNLGQLKNAPQRMSKNIPNIKSQIHSVNTSSAYFPPVDNRSNYEQMSQHSIQSSQHRNTSKDRQRITPISQKQSQQLYNNVFEQSSVKSIHQKFQIDEENVEVDLSQQFENSGYKQATQQKYQSIHENDNAISQIQQLANDVRSTVLDENDEIDVEDSNQQLKNHNNKQTKNNNGNVAQEINSKKMVKNGSQYQIEEDEDNEEDYQ